MKYNIVNLTPHEVVVRNGNYEIRIPPSGKVARVQQEFKVFPSLKNGLGEIPVVGVARGKIENLPEPKNGTIYIVSGIVLEAVKARSSRIDVFSPDTSPEGVIRDENGKIEAVRRLVVALEV